MRPELPPTDFSHQDRALGIAVTRIRRGESRAFAIVVAEFAGPLFDLSRGMLGNVWDAEEAVQEIFLQVHRSLERFDATQRLYPWVYTIAVNYLRSCLRRRGRRARLRVVGFPDEHGADAYPSRLEGPEDQMLRREAEALLDRALAQVKPSRREVFLLRRVRGLSVKEAAKVLRLPEGTVKTEVHRAQADLIRAIGEFEGSKIPPATKPIAPLSVNGGRKEP
jgi:RNA polymerase sigma-70 factor (ECF subfamily)